MISAFERRNDARTQASDFNEEGQLVTCSKDYLQASSIRFYENDPGMNESLSANSLESPLVSEAKTWSHAKNRKTKGTTNTEEINVACRKLCLMRKIC